MKAVDYNEMNFGTIPQTWVPDKPLARLLTSMLTLEISVSYFIK